jgi:hypothetical protein
VLPLHPYELAYLTTSLPNAGVHESTSDKTPQTSLADLPGTWRQLWVWLAEAEKELGIDISDEALKQMREHVTVSDEAFLVAREYEKKFRHDV